MTLPELLALQKEIAFFPGWSNPSDEAGHIYFNAPIIIAGVVQEGVFLFGGCFQGYPNQNVTFELAVSPPGAKRRGLDRIDWRSLQGGHTNKIRPGSPWSGKRVSETHHHTFTLNWVAHENRLRSGNLPQAMDIEEEMPTFESLRTYAGKSLRINNIGLVLPPPWEYKLRFDG